MWEYEYSAEAEVAPSAVWALWTDPLGWHAWNDGVGEVAVQGPFAAGSTFTMTPPGQDTIHMTITSVVENESWVDVAEGPGVLVTTYHQIADLGDGRTRVTYRTEITGDAADEVGPEFGPEICADFPDVVGKLLALAAGA